MQFAAKLISYIFHPVFMPLFGCWLIFQEDTEVTYVFSDERRQQGILMLLGVLALAPIICVLVLYLFRSITDLEMSRPEERLVPLVTTLIFYVLVYYLLEQARNALHPVILSSLSGAMVTIAIGTLLTWWYKVSLHAAGIWGVVGMLLALSEVVFYDNAGVVAAVMVGAGLVGTSRVIVGTHTVPQVMAGAILGFTVEYLFVRYELIF